MSDVINNHLRNVAIDKNNADIENAGSIKPIRRIQLEKTEEIFRFDLKQKNYLGDLAFSLEAFITKSNKLHNLMIVNGYTENGSACWELDYTKEYYELLGDFKKLKPKIQVLAKRKTRKSNINQSICEFFMLIIKPLKTIKDKNNICIKRINDDLFAVFAIEAINFNKKNQYYPIEVNDVLSWFNIQDILAGSCKVDKYLSDFSYRMDDGERERIIDDIFIMREYLFKGWRFKKHTIQINGYDIDIDLAASVPHFALSPVNSNLPDASCFDFIKIERCTYSVSLGHNQFMFFDVNADTILKEVYDYLLSIFIKIKVNFSIDSEKEEYIEYNPCELYKITNVFKKEHNEKLNYIDEGFENKRLLSEIKYSKFKSFMEKYFDCRFNQGKGSEIKVKRENSHIYTLGHHKQDFNISPLKVKDILKRLEINLNDFLSVAN